ncbi:hypothetical protein [Candidatus Protochlamydia amoebophila]|uniref:hypothetical protein n=1 Tax=Candidatus Protochlamydia amoebophila TaxID=362787 RepID=UPI001BC8DB0F|nr:hypothetical protein [Candidatus Protochlamydia amoebophila]
MPSPQKVVQFRSSNFITLYLSTVFLTGIIWLIFIGLSYAGFPFPQIEIEKFFDLGFFSISIFGVIVFLTMVPFQTVEAKLSPGFYSRIFNTPLAHFGIYVLMSCSIFCFLIIALQHMLDKNIYLSQLFIAMVTAIIFAILFHRFWVLRCLYQPYIVNKYINKLAREETDEEIWIELFECTYKSIKQYRVSDARNFIDLMFHVYQKCSDEEKTSLLDEDLMSLYAIAQESRPIARFIEEKWPFLILKFSSGVAPIKLDR